eukprot:scaffold83397_cov57-Phaeocystis_antarctica.AAC.2
MSPPTEPAAEGAEQSVPQPRGDGAASSRTLTHAQPRVSSRWRSLSCGRQGLVGMRGEWRARRALGRARCLH